MPSNDNLIAIAAMVVAIGLAALIFRLQREIRMHEAGERTWVAFADWLAIVGSGVALLFVILPILVRDAAQRGNLPAAATAMSVVFAVGYFPAIMAHYRLILAPEPARSG